LKLLKSRGVVYALKIHPYDTCKLISNSLSLCFILSVVVSCTSITTYVYQEVLTLSLCVTIVVCTTSTQHLLFTLPYTHLLHMLQDHNQ
jgi:hypothetical protein